MWRAVTVALAVIPAVGSWLLARTYRTDPALQALPTPKITVPAVAGAIATSAVVMACSPALGWTATAAAIVGPMFGIAYLTDAAGRVLPDLLTGAIAIIGLGLAGAGYGLPLTNALVGLIGFGVGLWLVRQLLLALFGNEAFGLGDVKLIAATATIMPVTQILASLIAAALIGIGVTIFRAVRPTDDPSLPFGSLFVAAFSVVTVLAAGLPVLGG